MVKSSAEFIEYTCPSTNISTSATGVIELEVTVVITLKNEVVTLLVVVDICIWLNTPPATASSAYKPSSLSRYSTPPDIYASIPLSLRNLINSPIVEYVLKSCEAITTPFVFLIFIVIY